MAVTKPMTPFDVEIGENPEIETLDFDMPDDANITKMATEDGEIIIEFGDDLSNDEDGEVVDLPHDTNFADIMEDGELQSLAADLVADFMSDRTSRKEWASAYIKGLDLLGMKIEDRTIPWQGASGVFHPMLAESVVRFQAQAMSEMMPAAGPVNTKTVGKMTREKFEQSVRVKNELNYLITEGDGRVSRRDGADDVPAAAGGLRVQKGLL